MDAYRSGAVDVLGSWMHYRESGAGPPVLLLHGNPTSSHLWRQVLVRVAEQDGGRRWIAPDLIGMGDSGKPAIGYRLTDHIAYLDAFIGALSLTDIVLVGHDWGVTLALDLLRRRPDSVRAVALMEDHLRPLSGWQAFDEGGRELFQRLRTPGLGEQMVLTENFFIDTLLATGLTEQLSEEDMAVYRAPYPDPLSRRPLLQWAREVPVAGQPRDVAERMAGATANLSVSTVPKLLLHGDPGVLISSATAAMYRDDFNQLTVVDVGGPAGHFLPEDRPDEVAEALIEWVSRLP